MTIAAASSGLAYSSMYFQNTRNAQKGTDSQGVFAEQAKAAPQSIKNGTHESNQTSDTVTTAKVNQSTSTADSTTTNTSSAQVDPQAYPQAPLVLPISTNGLAGIDDHYQVGGSFPVNGSITLDSGAHVSIVETLGSTPQTPSTFEMQFRTQNGQTIDISSKASVRVVENEDASTSVYYAEENMTRVYDAEGNTTEFVGNTLPENANTLFININDTEVVTGSGNDTIISLTEGAHISTTSGDDAVYIFANDQHIDLGEGNNTAYLTGRDGTMTAKPLISGITLIAGDGNNRVELESVLRNSEINLGNGNNILTGGISVESDISLGNGNNRIDVGAIEETSLTVGDGNNIFNMAHIRASSTFTVGDGENKMELQSIEDSSSLDIGNGNNLLDVRSVEYSSNMSVGNGNNTVEMYQVVNSSSLNLGNGDNLLDVRNVEYSSSMSVGDGNNTMRMYHVTDSSSLTLGNGDNYIDMHGITDSSKMYVGHGNNDIVCATVVNSSFTIGDGDNLIDFFGATKDNSTLSFGNGNNRVNTGSIIGGSAVSFGDGNNTFISIEVDDGSSITAGNGNNLVELFLLANSSSITLGNGNNAFALDYLAADSSVTVGDGNNDISVANIRDTSSITAGDGDNILQVYYVENTDNIHLGSGDNIGVIVNDNKEVVGYLVGDTVYTPAELENMAWEERNTIENIINEITNIRQGRTEEGLAIAANSILEFQEFQYDTNKAIVDRRAAYTYNTFSTVQTVEEGKASIAEKVDAISNQIAQTMGISQPTNKSDTVVDTIGMQNFQRTLLFQNKAFADQETSHARGVY